MYSKTYKGSIKRKLIFIMLFVTLAVVTAMYGLFVYWNLKSEYKHNIELSKNIGDVLSQNFAKLIFLNDVSVAADITTALKSFENVAFMVLYKNDKTVIYQYSKEGEVFSPQKLPDFEKLYIKQEKRILKIFREALYQGKKVGYVELGITTKSFVDIFKENVKILIFTYLFTIMFSFLLASYFAKIFTTPILKLVDFLEKIEFTGSKQLKISIDEDNEFGKLYDEVNQMLERINLAYQRQKIASVAFNTQSGMIITDAKKNILQVNDSFLEMSGYKKEELIGKNPSIFKSELHDDEFYKNMYQTLEQYHIWSSEIDNKNKNGSISSYKITIQEVLDEKGDVLHYVASYLDLSLQKETEAKLDYIRYHDVVTGLANKELLGNMLQNYLDNQYQKGYGGIISFDVKDFKMINDAYGHSFGDALLREISKRLNENFAEANVVARIGSDEFMLWFDFLEDTQEKTSFVVKTKARKIIEILSEPFVLKDVQINIDVFVGITIYNEERENAEELIKEADSALHIAKTQDKKMAFFDKKVEEIALAHIDMYNDLLQALKKEEFEMLYQPQYDEEKNICGAEALIRWNHSTKGIISPIDFIPVAEKTGFIVPLGEWIIRSVCKQLKLWSSHPTLSNIPIAINISAKQFKEEHFLDTLVKEVEANGIAWESIKLELTESLLVEDLHSITKKMEEIRKYGAKISLDDFGTGYSSLAYLKNLPIDQIKIDQVFVKNMLFDKRDVAIIKSVLLLGDALNIEIIAEGVETQEDYEFLKKLGCKYYQGYYFARPQKVSALEKSS